MNAERAGCGEDDAVRMILDCDRDVIDRIKAGAARRGVSIGQHIKDALALEAHLEEAKADGAELVVRRGNTLTVLDQKTPAP